MTLVSLIAFSSCQKSSSSGSPQQSQPESALEKLQQPIPENICSEAMLKLAKSVSETHKELESLNAQLKSAKSSDLESTFKSKIEAQKATCQSVEKQFESEKISACLKSETTKTKENSFYKSEFAKYCKTLKDKTQENKASDISLTFSDQAKQLVSNNSNQDITFISNGKIQSGHDQFKSSVQSGTATCVMTSQVAKDLKNYSFKYVTDTEDTKPETDIGFDFKGNRTVILLQDSENAMHSMLCLNLKMKSLAERKSALSQIFGAEIKIEEKEKVVVQTQIKDDSVKKAEALLNQDMAPQSQTLVPTQTADETQKKDKQENPLSDPAKLLDTALTKVEDSAEKTIEKSKEAAKEVIKTAAAETVKSANEIVDHAVDKATKSVVDTIKSPFIYVQEKVSAAVEAVKDTYSTAVKKSSEFISETNQKISKAYKSTKNKLKSYLSDWFSSK